MHFLIFALIFTEQPPPNVGTTTKDMRELELPGQENRNLLNLTKDTIE